ncbi:unnamed protein product [Paramecium octaurelia]|uniref:Uncharacterized protein n=1 Tax=Paramecium octaurelia TaxID=43137 RepID=A0A8S1YBR4_PAROT|nr:unnamed protein product [Paramecium octaurelia]
MRDLYFSLKKFLFVITKSYFNQFYIYYLFDLIKKLFSQKIQLINFFHQQIFPYIQYENQNHAINPKRPSEITDKMQALSVVVPLSVPLLVLFELFGVTDPAMQLSHLLVAAFQLQVQADLVQQILESVMVPGSAAAHFPLQRTQTVEEAPSKLGIDVPAEFSVHLHVGLVVQANLSFVASAHAVKVLHVPLTLANLLQMYRY